MAYPVVPGFAGPSPIGTSPANRTPARKQHQRGGIPADERPPAACVRTMPNLLISTKHDYLGQRDKSFRDDVVYLLQMFYSDLIPSIIQQFPAPMGPNFRHGRPTRCGQVWPRSARRGIIQYGPDR